MSEKEELLQKYNKLQEERDAAKRKGYTHIARARQYRMKLIEKRLQVIIDNEYTRC